MSRGAHYVECTGNPKNEDFECSDRIKFRYDQWNSYIWDHRHYFGVRVRHTLFVADYGQIFSGTGIRQIRMRPYSAGGKAWRYTKPCKQAKYPDSHNWS